jgi:hypothetical protein
MQILMDKKPLNFNGAAVVDLSTSFRSVARDISSDSLELTEGMHVMTIKPAGSKPGAVGLDFIWVQRL